MSNLFNTLNERGFIKQTSHPEELEKLLEREKVTFYLGIDPTADSMQIGHLVPIMMLKHILAAGHRVLLVLGGGTVAVGDPTDKTEMRSITSFEVINSNKAALKEQLYRMFDFTDENAIFMDNADWLLKLNYVHFLREIGSQFSVNRMLQAECYRSRLERPEGGLSFIELNYMIMQAYDFLHLYREFGCKVQIGGDDQWSNILAGADLIRRLERGEAHAVTMPLITTADGQKMGKTVAGAIWLDEKRSSAYELYQYWRNTRDADVTPMLALFTYLPMDEVRRLGSAEGLAINESKKMLAFEVTKLVHGEQAAKEAAEAADALFGGGGDAAAIPTTYISAEALKTGVNILDALLLSGLVASKGEGRRLIARNGLSLNGVRITEIDHILTEADLSEGRAMLRKGRKDYHAIRVTE